VGATVAVEGIPGGGPPTPSLTGGERGEFVGHAFIYNMKDDRRWRMGVLGVVYSTSSTPQQGEIIYTENKSPLQLLNKTGILMTITEPSVVVAPSFVLPDTISPAIADLIDHVRPSVVQIRSGGRGNGTGVIWRTNGAILTNDHVVAHANGRVQVLLTDGRTLDATVGARNADLD